MRDQAQGQNVRLMPVFPDRIASVSCPGGILWEDSWKYKSGSMTRAGAASYRKLGRWAG